MVYLNGHPSKSGHHFLFAGLLAIGLVASTAGPVQAGTATFSTTGSMNTARIGHSYTLLANGHVLVAGGDGQTPSTAELYNPATGAWTATGSMTTARSTNLVLLPSGEVLAAGGDTNDSPNTAELYNPDTGTWRATGSLGPGGFGGSTILLQNGLVLALTRIGSIRPRIYMTPPPAPGVRPRTRCPRALIWA